MTDYTKLVEALRDIEKTMFALGTSPINMGDVSISLAYDKRWGQTAERAAAAIEALQAELPKRGKWLIHSTGGSMATKKCPFCGSESWQSKEYAKVPKYCENCGAHLPTFDIVDWVHYLHAKTEVQE